MDSSWRHAYDFACGRFRDFLEQIMALRAAISPLILASALCLFCGAVSAQREGGTRHVLDVVEPDLNFTNVPLSDTIDFIRDSTDSNVVVDWKSLEAVNIDRDTLVNVRLRHVTVRKALSVILSQVGAGNLLAFYVEDNVLQITTQAKADTILYTMVYPVRDLLVDVPNFQMQDVTNVLSSGNSGGGGTSFQTGSSGGGAGAQSNTNFGGSSQGLGQNQTTTETEAEKGADLVKLIMDTVRPEVWRENGGNSSIRYFRGLLIVTAPISVQEAIGGPVE
jgi:hypothetical protein